MSSWLEAKVIENRRWTEALFSLRVALAEGAPRLAFGAGGVGGATPANPHRRGGRARGRPAAAVGGG